MKEGGEFLKKYIVTYHLGKDIECIRQIEAEDEQLALDDALPQGGSIIQFIEKNVLYRFSAEDIQMISVTEKPSVTVKSVRSGRY